MGYLSFCGGINTFLVSSTMQSLLLEVILLRGLKDLPFGSDWLRIKCLQKTKSARSDSEPFLLADTDPFERQMRAAVSWRIYLLLFT